MIKKIHVDHLEVGMFIEDFNAPWMDHPFLVNKKKIKSAKEIDLLRSHGLQEVYINAARGKDSARAVSVREAHDQIRNEMKDEVLESNGASSSTSRSQDTIPFEVELRRAKKVYGEAKTIVKGLLQDARMGKAVDAKQAAKAVDGMVDSIFRNHDALASLSRLKSFDDYTFQHSLNVSVLALTLGRHLGMVQGELKRLGIGSILHDIGKMRVPEEILNKPGRLTDEEFAVIQTHSLHGAKILMDTQDVPDECAAVALNHHERFNGNGYPRGLEGLAIGKFGLISAIVDVYDAITSDRVYHKGMPNHQALQKIYEWAKTDFYPIYVQKFVQCLGIYPTGSAVALDTEEIGVVCRQNHAQLLRPWVRVVQAASGELLVPPIDVDLSEADPAGEKECARTIERVLDAKQLDFDLEAALMPAEARSAA